MSDRVQTIRQTLERYFAPVYLDVIDESAAHAGHAGARAGGGHYAVTVVSAHFRNQDNLTRHRLVYQALQEMMRRDIHALRIRALTPEEHGPVLKR